MKKHLQRCEEQEITSSRTSNEPHLFWKKHFPKNPVYIPIFADFEADIEIDNTHIGNKTTMFNKQNPVLIGFYIVSELNDVLEGGY